MEKDNRGEGEVAANVLLHTQMLVSGLDDLEDLGVYKQKLKHTGNMFKKELESTMDEVHKHVTAEQNDGILLIYDLNLSILQKLDQMSILEKDQLNNLLPLTISKIQFEGIERSLIVKKEWLDLIFDGGKVWEMRSKKTKLRGRFGIIEAGTGLIVGEVEIVDSLPAVNTHKDLIKFHKVEDTSLIKKWCYPWVLKNAKRYKTPIPYKHPKGAVIWVKHN